MVRHRRVQTTGQWEEAGEGGDDDHAHADPAEARPPGADGEPTGVETREKEATMIMHMSVSWPVDTTFRA